jgi:serine/threonine-protein kinase
VEFKRAIALNPNYATLHQWHGESLQAQGRFKEALTEIQRAHELDPLSLIINSVYGAILDCTGRGEEAIQQLRRTIELDPSFSVAPFILGQVLEKKEDLKGAAREYEKAIAMYPHPIREAVLAGVYARTGRRSEAERILHDLTPKSQDEYVSPYALALCHLALGDKEEALRLLEKAYDERSIQLGGNTGSLKIDPRLDPLRGDPRFEKLLARYMEQTQ